MESIELVEILACAAPPAASWRSLAGMVAFVLFAFAFARSRAAVESGVSKRSS